MKIYFYIETVDKSRFIGLSLYLQKKYPDLINKCFKFSIKDTTKYAVNISLNSPLDKEIFDNITKDISGHFKKDLLIFYKTGDETDNKKYTYSNIRPKTITTLKTTEKYMFIHDE